MSLAQKINLWLSGINLAVTRRSTLDRILTELEELRKSARCAGIPPSSEKLEGRLAPNGQRLEDLRSELLRHQIATKWEVVDFVLRVMVGAVKSRRCPLCGHDDLDEAFAKFETHCIFGGGELLRHQCPACDVIFGPDKMFQLSDAELAQDYEWHYRSYEEGDSTEQELRAFHCLTPSRAGTYLNYGAGAWSRSVQLLRDQGWQVLAFEPHGSASTSAEYVISSRSALSTMRFDGVFSNNVLEHFRRPVEELVFMRGLLTPGGRMSHATPCFEYLYEYTRFHLFFFRGRSRALLTKQAGLAIREFISDGEFMSCVLEPEGT